MFFELIAGGFVAMSASAGGNVDALVRREQAIAEAGRESSERSRLVQRLTVAPADRAALLALATLDRFCYRDVDAEREYRSLADGHDELADYAVLGLGLLRAQESRLIDATPLLHNAATALQRDREPSAEAEALTALGSVLSRTQSLDSAAALDRLALQIIPPADVWLRSLITCNTLLVEVRRADPRVVEYARSYAAAARTAGNPRAAAACLAALAQDYERRTLIDSALATFKEVEAIQRATRNLGGLAGTLQWRGYMLYAEKGNAPEARELLTSALALGRRTSALTAAAWAAIDLSDLAMTFGDLRASGTYAREANSMFVTTGDRWGMAEARMHEGDVALLNGNLFAARSAHEQVVKDAAAIAPSFVVHAHGRLAAIAVMEGNPDEAERELDLANRMSVELRMTEWRQEDAYNRALVALSRGKLDEAEQRLRLLDRLLPPDTAAVRADLYIRLAEVSLRRHDIDGAVRNLVVSNDLVDRWRAMLTERDLQLAVVQAHGFDWDPDLSFATIIHEIALSGRASIAFTLAEQRRARVLLEHLTQREVLARMPARSKGSPVLSDSAVQRLLPESTAVLAFVTGQGREPTTVFVVSRNRLAATSADAVDDHVLDIDRFTGLLAAGDSAPELAQRLGEAFLRSALALVPRDVRRLVVIPDGPLHRLPFDALSVRDGHPLVERFAIALAPSASVAATWWASAPRTPGPRLVAFGDPVGVTLSGAGGDSVPPRLPAAAAEVQSIASFAPESDVFIGNDARESTLRRERMTNVGVLHFATHADVDEWSLLHSALILAPGDGQDGRVGADELLRMHFAANLVVLSACSSASGEVLTGEGLQGLTSPFLEAGASSVVATLWQIHDRSAAQFVRLFYDELATGETVGNALNRAKLRARAENVSPGVWAAFTLTGDDRVRTALRKPAARSFTLLPVALLVFAFALYFASRTKRRRKADLR